MADVLTYLSSKGLHLKPAGSSNVHTACMFCQEDPGARGRLYINVDTDAEIPGLYFCHRCQAKGHLATLKRHFGDAVGEDELDYQVRSEILNFAAAYYRAQLDQFPEVHKYLTGPARGLLDETLERHQIGYAPMCFERTAFSNTVTRPRGLYSALRDAGYRPKDIFATGLCTEWNDKIVDSLGGMITIPYHTGGNVVAIRGRTWPLAPADFEAWGGISYDPPKGKYKTCGGTGVRLFGADRAWDADRLLITEGEFDALILEQEGYVAVGVPGANSWQASWDGYLDSVKRVFVVFDRDPAGEQAAAKLIERIGPKARQICLSEPGIKCDPTEWFSMLGHTQDEFDDLLDEASRGGLLVTVAEAIAEFNEIQGQPGIRFAWEALDTHLRPGLQGGQLMVVLAKSGTGKTILQLNLMHRIRMVPGQEDAKILFLSLEQTRGEWWDRARRIHRFFNIQSDEHEAADWWRDNLLIVDRNRLTEADLRVVFDDFDHRMGRLPDIVFLDYLGYFARGFRGEAYERTSQAVMAIKGVAKESRVPVFSPHQVSRIGVDGEEFEASAARDSGVIEETSDFLLTMWAPDNALGKRQEEKNGQIHFRIAKSRHGGRGAEVTMTFAPISLAMIPERDPLGARARREIEWRNTYFDNWPKAVFRHRTGIEGALSDGEWEQP